MSSDIAATSFSGAGHASSKLTIILVGVSLTVALGTAVASFAVLLVLYTDISREYARRQLKEPEDRNRSEGILDVIPGHTKQAILKTDLDRTRSPQKMASTKNKLSASSRASPLKPTYRFKEAQEKELPPVVKSASSNQKRKDRTTSRSRRRYKHELNFMHTVTPIRIAIPSSSLNDGTDATTARAGFRASNIAKRTRRWHIITKRRLRTPSRCTTEATTLLQSSSSARHAHRWYLITRRIPRRMKRNSVSITEASTRREKHSRPRLKPADEPGSESAASRKPGKVTSVSGFSKTKLRRYTSTVSNTTSSKYTLKNRPRLRFYSSRIPKRRTRSLTILCTTAKTARTVRARTIHPEWKIGDITRRDREVSKGTLSEVLNTDEAGRTGGGATMKTGPRDIRQPTMIYMSYAETIPDATLKATKHASRLENTARNRSSAVLEDGDTRSTRPIPLASEYRTPSRNTQKRSPGTYSVVSHTAHDKVAKKGVTDSPAAGMIRPFFSTQDEGILGHRANELGRYVEINLKAGRGHSRRGISHRAGEHLGHLTVPSGTPFLPTQESHHSHAWGSSGTKPSQGDARRTARGTRSTDLVSSVDPSNAPFTSRPGSPALPRSPSKLTATVMLEYRKPRRFHLAPKGPRLTTASTSDTRTITIEVVKATRMSLPSGDPSTRGSTNAAVDLRHLRTTRAELKPLPNRQGRSSSQEPTAMYRLDSTTPGRTGHEDTTKRRGHASLRNATGCRATTVPYKPTTQHASASDMPAVTRRESEATANNNGTAKTVPTEPFADYNEPFDAHNTPEAEDGISLGHWGGDSMGQNDRFQNKVGGKHLYGPTLSKTITALEWPTHPTQPVFVQREKMHNDLVNIRHKVTTSRSSPRTRPPHHGHKKRETKKIYSGVKRHTHPYPLTTIWTAQALQDQFRTTPDTPDSPSSCTVHNGALRRSTAPRSTEMYIYDVENDIGVYGPRAKVAIETTESHLGDNIDLNPGILHTMS